MSADSETPDSAAIDERAADWLARRDAGLTDAERLDFERWLAADPRHRTAFAAVESAWRIVTRPARRGLRDDVLGEMVRLGRRRRRRQAGWGLAFAGAVAAVAFVVVPRPAAPPATIAAAPAAGVVARPERHVLADGSAIELKAGAEFETAFSATERRVRLARGTAHFDVAKDEARPFVVVAGATAVRAVGTEFVVQVAATDVGVLVTEGLVQVAPADPAATIAPVLVSAGRRTVVAARGSAAAVPAVEAVSPEAIADALAWRTQRVEFSNLPLGEVVAVFNRTNRMQLVLGDRSLAALRISGIYWTDNPLGFAELMAAGFDLKVAHPQADTVSLGR
jgi:transmembrane sensor